MRSQLTLLAPAAAVEAVSDAPARRARRAVGVDRGRRRRHATPSARCSTSPACRRRARPGARSTVQRAVRRRGRGDRGGDAAARAATGAAALRVESHRSRSPTQDWVRAHAGAVRAGARSRRRSGSCRPGRRPPRRRAQVIRLDPGLRLRHRHASDDAHVPALDRRARRAAHGLAARARLRLRLGHPRDRAPRCSARATSTRSTSTRRRSRRRGPTRSPTASRSRPACRSCAVGPLRARRSPTSSPRR